MGGLCSKFLKNGRDEMGHVYRAGDKKSQEERMRNEGENKPEWWSKQDKIKIESDLKAEGPGLSPVLPLLNVST